MTRASLAERYRPQRFDDVFGQESVVACLSGLIRRGQIGRDVLLHGAIGSGKTSLARLYARALNCEDPDADGSPCRTRCELCRPCDTPRDGGQACGRCRPCARRQGSAIAGMHDYNVSKLGGGEAKVRSWVEERNRDETSFQHRILFFDEAQALSREACDMLLDHVERPAARVLFFFATTEVDRIRKALRSRLFDLLVRSLDPLAAVAFLRRYADQEGIVCEPGALELLAGVREGHPRDLLLGLDRVHEPDTPLTVARVRGAFDVDQTEILVAYFHALADGDLGRQTDLVFGWLESGADRIRWIQAFLVSLYHNDILHRRLIVDGLIACIPEQARASILDGFCRRLGIARHAALEPVWHRMMAFWPVPATEGDETALALRLTLFHRLVNGGLLDRPDEGACDQPTPALPEGPQRVSPAPAVILVGSSGFGPGPQDSPCARAGVAEPGFLTALDARRIVNCASFLTQEHGVLFNTAIEVEVALEDIRTQAEGVALILRFSKDLGDQAATGADGPFASLTVLERKGSGLVGRIVAHLPRPANNLARSAEAAARVEAWAQTWGRTEIEEGDDIVMFATAPADEASALDFHWRRTLALCAGLDPALEAWDPKIGRCRPLLKLLKVPPRRGLGPVAGHPLVVVSPLLSDEAIAEACRYWLEPLSAFDHGAWTWIEKGWERLEFEERRRTRAQRAGEIEGLMRRPGVEVGRAETAGEELPRGWSIDPQERARRWRGWW